MSKSEKESITAEELQNYQKELKEAKGSVLEKLEELKSLEKEVKDKAQKKSEELESLEQKIVDTPMEDIIRKKADPESERDKAKQDFEQMQEADKTIVKEKTTELSNVSGVAGKIMDGVSDDRRLNDPELKQMSTKIYEDIYENNKQSIEVENSSKIRRNAHPNASEHRTAQVMITAIDSMIGKLEEIEKQKFPELSQNAALDNQEKQSSKKESSTQNKPSEEQKSTHHNKGDMTQKNQENDLSKDSPKSTNHRKSQNKPESKEPESQKRQRVGGNNPPPRITKQLAEKARAVASDISSGVKSAAHSVARKVKSTNRER